LRTILKKTQLLSKARFRKDGNMVMVSLHLEVKSLKNKCGLRNRTKAFIVLVNITQTFHILDYINLLLVG
jgi:hypothetical protein